MIINYKLRIFFAVFIGLIMIGFRGQIVYADTVISDVTATASSYVEPYSPDRAVNTTVDTTKSADSSRWYCVNSGDKWLQLDLKKNYYIDKWHVENLGSLSWDVTCNTKDYELLGSMDGIHWTTIKTISGNISNTTDNTVIPFSARYVKLHITQGNQNNNLWASIVDFHVSAVSPVVSSYSVPSSGIYTAGQNLDFTVNYPADVVVNTASGTPCIPITIGSKTVNAQYLSGTGTKAITFRYTVQNGDSANGIGVGTSIVSNGGTITDYAQNSANLTLNTAADTTGIKVDAAAPNLTEGEVNRTSDTEAVVKFTSDEDGEYYYAVVAAGAAATTIDTSGTGTACTISETTITNPIGLTAGAKDIYIKVKDEAGNVSSALKIDIPVYVAPNLAPTCTATVLNPTVTASNSAAALFSSTSVSTVETSQKVKQIILTVDGLKDGASEILQIDGSDVNLVNGTSGITTTSNFSYNVAVSDSTATVTITKNDWITIEAQDLINGLKYNNSSINCNHGNRTVTLTSIQDDGGTDNGGVDTTALSIASTVNVMSVSAQISSIAVPAAGTYIAGQNFDFTVNFDKAVNVTGTPRIALIIGSNTKYANYLSGSGSTALIFRYKVEAGELDADGITIGALSLNGGNIKDNANNDAELTLKSVGATAGVKVDAVIPSLAAGEVNRTSDTQGAVKFTSDKDGQYYYAVVAAGAEVPTIDTSITGTACTTSETTIINPIGLTAGAKDIYIKVKDEAGNVSSALKIDIAAYVAPNPADSTEAAVDHITAINGTVSIVLDKMPAVAPTTGDFIATSKVNSGTASAITLTNFAWNPGTKTVTYNFIPIAKTAASQSVVVGVSYKGGTAVEASPFTVDAAVPNSSTITPTNATFDKYTSGVNYKDIAVAIDLKGNTLNSIKNGTNTLIDGTDYTTTGSAITIKKEYLKTQPNGTTNLTFKFSAGGDGTLAIIIGDSTPAPYTPPYVPPYNPQTPTPQPTTETREVPVVVDNGGKDTNAAQVPVTRTTDSDGTKTDTVKFDEDKVKETVTKALEAKTNTATINVTDIPGNNADKVEVQVPQNSMTQLGSNNIGLDVKTEKAALELPKETVNGLKDKDAKIQISEVKDSSKVEETKGLILKLASGSELIAAPLKIETNFTGRTKITLSIEASKLPSSKEELDKYLSSLAVMVQHSDGENVIDKGTIVYDEKGKPIGISIWVDKFSDFTLVSLPESYFQGRTTVIKDKVAADKEWNIKFTKIADSSTITKDNVYVADLVGNKVEVEVSYGSDNILKVKSVNPYKSGETYYLYISKNVKSKDKTSLVNELRYQFTIK